jgi:N-acetylglutamate synthase-like GNAT family acetyltransferase
MTKLSSDGGLFFFQKRAYTSLMSSWVRKATAADMDGVYLMGYDAWGKRQRTAEYLASCRSSHKYNQGEWFLLEDAGHVAVSSLIVYRLSSDSAGIGSIATVPEKRKRGFGAELVRSIVELLDQRKIRAIFLFSDIAPKFYEQFGFKALPPEYQKHSGSVCMIRARSMEGFLKSPDFRLPDYF